MVSTRGQPEGFTKQELTPTKRGRKAIATSTKWAHSPANVTLIWLAISLPLVMWDTGYIMLRPHTMPGGKYQWPIWTPYELYGKVDYIYGWKAYHAKNGFTAAQGFLNIIETLMYMYYLYIMYAFGRQSTAQGRGAPSPATVGFLGQQRFVDGKQGAIAVLVGYSAAVMTVSKTVLYWANEYFSGFENIGHNTFSDLLFLWIIPNGAWLVVPSYIIYITGSEIVQGLSVAAGVATSDDIGLLKAE